MNKEQARLTLQENAQLLHFEHPNLGIKEAIEVVIDALSQPSLPSNLDEAAEAHRRKVYCGDSEMCQFVREVFKAGAKWMAAQFEKVEGGPIDWYQTSDGKEYCHGIDTDKCLEVQDFYIRKK